LTVAHLLLHHVEALVAIENPSKVDVFTSLVLRSLTLARPRHPADLERLLHLGPNYLGRLLNELARAGLAEVDAAGAWQVTPAGREAMACGRLARRGYERRAFHFRDALQPGFVPLMSAACHQVSAPDQWRFTPARLQDCVAQPAEWKRRHGFPEDVGAVLTSDSPGEPPAWQRIMVDRAEHLVLLLAVSGEGRAERLSGFAVEPRGWVLEYSRPILRLGPDWPEVFPEAAAEPSPEAWRGAWRICCQGHGVAAADADACSLAREGALLRVRGPGEVLRRLPREDLWILAGEGMMRTAARAVMAPLAA
jgi:hypothetical protein